MLERLRVLSRHMQQSKIAGRKATLAQQRCPSLFQLIGYDIVEGMVSAAIVTGTSKPLDFESTSYTFLVESPGSFMAIVPLDCLAYERSVIVFVFSFTTIPVLARRCHSQAFPMSYVVTAVGGTHA